MFAISPARVDPEPAPGTLHPAPEWQYDNQVGAGDQRLWSIREGLRNNTHLAILGTLFAPSATGEAIAH